jgi:hypothetical protein
MAAVRIAQEDLQINSNDKNLKKSLKSGKIYASGPDTVTQPSTPKWYLIRLYVLRFLCCYPASFLVLNRCNPVLFIK